MNTMPPGVSRYATTPEFTEDTIPANLLHFHRTDADTWAKIVVLRGKLRYRILGPNVEEHELSRGQPGIVEPGIPHQVEAVGNVRFQVEFYR